MGTILEIQIVGDDEPLARALTESAFDEVARLERLVSHYDPRSEVSQLAASSGQGPRRVDPAVLELVRASLEQGDRVGGVFDVTLGPVIDFWRTADPDVPDAAALAEVRSRTGHDKLVLHPDGTIELTTAGMELDFGGIAKGWALDRVVVQLRAEQVEAALLSFGQSSIWALGAPRGAEGWALAVRSPRGGIAGRITLRDQALSISSSIEPAEPARSDGGEEGRAPIVNPRTAWPVDAQALAAVVAPDAMSADVISTSLLILDPYSAIKLVESLPGVEAMILDARGNRFKSTRWDLVTRYREARRQIDRSTNRPLVRHNPSPRPDLTGSCGSE